MTRWIGMLMLILLLCLAPISTGYAQDPVVVDIFNDALYGGLAGLMVGAAFLAFTSEADEHLHYLTRGMGVGVLAGAAYGVYTARQAYALIPPPVLAIEGTQVQWNFPVLQVRISRSPLTAGTAQATYYAPLLRVHY